MFWMPNSTALRRSESYCAALENLAVLDKSLVTQPAKATTISDIAMI